MVHLPATEESPENTGDDSGNTGGNSGDSGNITPTTYSVTFTVQNSSGNGIKAEVTLTDKSDSSKTYVQNEQTGTITVTGVPAGTYSVSVSHNNYTAPASIPDVTVTNADVTVSDPITMTQD